MTLLHAQFCGVEYIHTAVLPVLHSPTKLPCVPKLDTEAGFELWWYWLLTVSTG